MQKSLTLLATLLFFSNAWSKPQTTAQGERRSVEQPGTIAHSAVDLPSEPGVYAVIYTSMGNITCRLFEKDAPKAVANFVGLSSGAKQWTNPRTGKIMRRTPLYSGAEFHRVIPDFMIQGGDPAGDGTGSPGYEFANEVGGAHAFDRPGILAMANHGPNTNGSQFFITVGPAEHLNGNYTIFGEVLSGQDVADAISKVPRDSEDKPLAPVKILRIAVHDAGKLSVIAPNTVPKTTKKSN